LSAERSAAASSRALACCLLLAALPAAAADFAYEIRAGDNPWNLTQRYLKDLSYWPRIQQYNRIAEPRRLQPGARLLIPEQWLRLQTREVRTMPCTARWR